MLFVSLMKWSRQPIKVQRDIHWKRFENKENNNWKKYPNQIPSQQQRFHQPCITFREDEGVICNIGDRPEMESLFQALPLLQRGLHLLHQNNLITHINF